MGVVSREVRIESKVDADFNCLDAVSMPESGGMVWGVQVFEYGISVLVKKENKVFLYALPNSDFLPELANCGYEVLQVIDLSNKLKKELTTKVSGL